MSTATPQDPDAPSASTLATLLEYELQRAREDLDKARRDQAKYDTPRNRDTVSQCRKQLDGLLDMRSDADRAQRGGPA